MDKKYTKTTWENGKTRLNATNLNHIEDGIETLYNEALDENSLIPGNGANIDKVGDKLRIGIDIVEVTEHLQASGYVEDPDYIHTDNNFTDAEKTKLDGIDMATKQDTLVSGENIMTINGNSILGSGNMEIQTGSGGTTDYTDLINKPSINGTTLEGNLELNIPTKTSDLTNDSDFATTGDIDGLLDTKQDTLVSGENIMTINGNSILGSGNMEIQTGSGGTTDYTDLINKPSINGQTLEGDITISGDTVIDSTHLDNAGSDAVTKATDSMDLKARLLGVNATEEKAVFTPVDGYYDWKTDTFVESANNSYAIFNVEGKNYVRFIGIYCNSMFSTGYCFKDSNDSTVERGGWDIDYSLSSPTIKEYTLKVPEGATTFITLVKSSPVASLESSFYCYIGTGNTVYENLNEKLIDESVVKYGFNLLSRATIEPGRLGTKGEVVSTSSYYVTPFIPLNGQTVYWRGTTAYGSTTNGGAIYDKNFNCVKVFKPTSIQSYTPEHDYECYIRLTLTKTGADSSGSVTGVFYALPDGSSPNLTGMYNTIVFPDNEQRYETKYTDITVHKESVPELLPVYSSVAGSKGMTVIAESLTDNRIIVPTTYPSYIKDVHTIAAKAYFEGDFPSDAWVRVGTNKGSSAGKTVQINATTIAIRSYNNQLSDYVSNISFTHGLTLKDFIMLEVNFTWDGGYIRLISSGDAYIKDWKVSDYTSAGGAEYLNYGRAYVEQSNITLSNITLRQNSEAFKKPIWILGDSYTSMYSRRWPYQLVLNYKVDNFLLSGFAGATSDQMFTELQRLLNYGTPKYLVWCLGMNDGTYDATWLVTAKQIEGICSQKGIELIYQTIPQPTSGNKQLINNYIKSSGYRYVDAFSAVCKPDGTWYDGMNDDGVHPTTLGSKAIAGQFIIDLPELTHK